MANLQVDFEWKDGYLLVTPTGQATFGDALETYKKACDLATKNGVEKILVDCRAVEAEFSTLERYTLGQTMAKYCLERSMNPKIATVGMLPTIDGFAHRVASNRGVMAATFSQMKPALEWLAAFGPTTPDNPHQPI